MLNNRKLNILKNVAFYIFIFFITITIVFFAINLLIEPRIKKNLAIYQQIPSNLLIRFKIFLKNLFTFNPGKIYSYELASVESNILILYLKQLKWSILVSFIIFSISFILGNILGITSAYKLNKTFDIIITIAVSLFAAIPLLIIAILALINSSFFGYPSQFIYDRKFSFISLLIPIIISSFPTIAIFFSKSRKKTLEILKSEYYLFAKTYGLNKRQLLNKVILKNLLISQLNLFFVIYVLLFTITILIESIFSIPGQSLFISFAFKKGEIDIIMFYFMFNFILLSILIFLNNILIKKMNPILASNSYLNIKFKKMQGGKHE
ncbi:ABC transporter permease subunit [Metamycoplasma auris]|uniref:Peptide/nickel transport system permease protein/oligopeptide transport system permease protein n=1 Tax=Metamycoplasma auris TaxID=51363 RepID=A0A2W7G4D5_9BACT|nr:ABC transporter permease subunit [Metamycoplasma auris]PZW01442.1 peptide/nickel transport system permease protein/oligopeptide transport system permease protein [Metamycoplasma auris]